MCTAAVTLNMYFYILYPHPHVFKLTWKAITSPRGLLICFPRARSDKTAIAALGNCWL